MVEAERQKNYKLALPKYYGEKKPFQSPIREAQGINMEENEKFWFFCSQ